MSGLDLAAIFSLNHIVFNMLGVAIGIIFGAVPGLTSTMGVALFIPFTFGMEAVSAFALLLGIYCGSVYGGAITAVLIRTPGTAASAATVLDGYPLAMKGEAFAALSGATIGSAFGGLFSCLALILFAPQLARIALEFGPPEYFAVGLFGLSIVSSVSGNNILKGVLAAMLGLMCATIGMDPITGEARFTFGTLKLMAGVDLVSALIGLFAISEVLSKLETLYHAALAVENVRGKIIGVKILLANTVNLIRSSAIGTVIGVIPATGSATAAWLSYNEARRASGEAHLFGKGSYEGLLASETANNAVTGGALVPLLTLGIPGDVITAILLGALMIQGLTPGPMLFTEHASVVHGIYGMMVLSQIFMLLLGLLFIKAFVRVLKVPQRILMPFVLVLCFVGAYTINSSVFDMQVAVVMGLVGYAFTKTGFPLPPVLLGLILGPIIESNFRRSLGISQGSLSIFLSRPLCACFILVAFCAFCWPLIRNMVDARNASRLKAAQTPPGAEDSP